MHSDTTHEANNTLECLLLKISTKYDFEPFFSCNKTFCRWRTGRFGAMNGKMLNAGEPAWLCAHIAIRNYSYC